MASIRRRKKSDGTVSFTVLWRAGGARDGKQESEVFGDEVSACRFRDLVNGHRQEWPPGWVRGRGFVEQETHPACHPEEMFGPFAEKHVELLTGIQDDTRGKYLRQVQQKMLPWFGHLSVRDGEGGIGRDDIARWVNALELGNPPPRCENPEEYRALKPKTVRNLHGLLYSILQQAVLAEPPLRKTNPAASTRLPRSDDSDDDKMIFLEREEFALLLSCLEGDAREMVKTLAGTGMRLGEVTAIQRRDLVFRGTRPAIRVQRAWKKDDDHNLYLGPPKTKKSRRTIILTGDLHEMLQCRSQGLKPDSLLFPFPGGVRGGAEAFRRQVWRPALVKAGRYGLDKRPRLHDLRHSHASWLIAAKVPAPAIQARLGHESIKTTVDRYGHLLDAMDDEIAAAVTWAMELAA